MARLDAAVAMAAGQAGTDLLLAQGEALLAGGQPDRAVMSTRTCLSGRGWRPAPA